MKRLYSKAPPACETEFWEQNWDAEAVDRQVEALRWSEYIPIFEKHVQGEGMILENGCGLGGPAQFFHSRGQNVVGLDFVYKPLSMIREYRPGIGLVNGNGFRLPFRSETFSAVLSLGVVEHFEHGYNDLIRECRRVLRKDGTLVISVPYANIFETVGLQFAEEGGTFYAYLFEESEFKEVVRRNGFHVTHCYFCNRLAHFYRAYSWAKAKIRPQPAAVPAAAVVPTASESASSEGRAGKWLPILNKAIPHQLSSNLITLIAVPD